jgi:predicted dehydrogenase
MHIAVLGTGGMGRGEISNLLKCAEVDAVTGYDINPAQLALVTKNKQVNTTTNLKDILSNPNIPLVFITASNDAHASLALQAMEAGKAVMCEKPMATTLKDAKAMVDAAEKNNVYLQIGFELRYSRLYSMVKQWTDEGLLGDIMNTHCYYICSEFHGKGSWRNKTATGGSMFGEKLSHYVDLPRWWINAPVRDVNTVCAPNVIPYYEVRDNYHTTYRFTNGAVSHLTFMMAVGETFDGDPLQDILEQQVDDGHALRYMIVGTKGAAELDVFRRSIKRWEFGDSPKCFTSKWVENLTWDKSEDQIYYHNTRDQNIDIVYRVANNLPPKTAPRDSFETMALCAAVEQSADDGCPIDMADFIAGIL